MMVPRPQVRKPIALPGIRALSRRARALKTYWLNEAAWVFFGYLLLGYLTLEAEGTLFQVLLAAGLALFGVGFSITAALAPRSGVLGVGERIALSTYMSLSVGGLLGFALSRSPWGLRLEPLLVSALLLNLVCYLVIVYRRRRLEAGEPGQGREASLAPLADWWKGQSPLSLGITLILVLLIALGGLAFKNNLLAPGTDPAMTEFFLLDEAQQIQAFPQVLPAGEVLTLTYGITNREDRPLTYVVRAASGGEPLGTGPQVFLQPGQSYTGLLALEIPLALAAPGEKVRVDFDLYQAETVHRSLHLWFGVE
jgi:uncharacterized membrane protein